MAKLASLLIKGAKVIDPSIKIDKKADILIEKGKISQISNITKKASNVINGKDLVAIPGLIDMHVHFRQPGREDEETINSGQKAAIAGGVTTVCTMPNTKPTTDNKAVIELIEKEADDNLATVYPVGAITKNLEGKEIAEMNDMAKAGAVAFTDDGNTVMDSSVMMKACLYSKAIDLPLIVHAEDKNLTQNSQMNESINSTELGLKGAPAIAEEFIIARDIILSSYTGARIHFAHISTKGSVELIRKAKKNKVSITAEVSPHHLVLDDSYLKGYDSNYKVNPPLRCKEDIEELIKGLKDGTIDAIATDHAPHSQEEKEKEFNYAPNGIIGLETMVSIVFGKLVSEGKLSINDAIEKLTYNPANILNFKDRGSFEDGNNGDVVLINMKNEIKINSANFSSLSRNTPFGGWKVKAEVIHVVKNGNIVYKDGGFVDS